MGFLKSFPSRHRGHRHPNEEDKYPLDIFCEGILGILLFFKHAE